MFICVKCVCFNLQMFLFSEAKLHLLKLNVLCNVIPCKKYKTILTICLFRLMTINDVTREM